MYTLTHDGDKIGTSHLESGDPSIHSVSGVLINVGGAKAMAKFIQSINGKEEDGVIYAELDASFELLDAEREKIAFESGTLIAIPAEDEVFLDLAFSAEAYQAQFAEHISAMGE